MQSQIDELNTNITNSSYFMRTYSQGGGQHGDSWLMKAQYNRTGDGRFRLYCGDGSIGTSVDYADSANIIMVSGIPSAAQLKSAKLLIVHVGGNNHNGKFITVAYPDNHVDDVGIIFDGTNYNHAVWTITWSKSNGTLSINPVTYQTYCVNSIENTILIF